MPNFYILQKCQIKSFLSRILRFLLISQSVCQIRPNLIWTSKSGANPSGASPVWCYALSTDPINKLQTWLEVCDINKHSSLLVRPMSFQEKPFCALPANVRLGWNFRKTTNVLTQQPHSIQVKPFCCYTLVFTIKCQTRVKLCESYPSSLLLRNFTIKNGANPSEAFWHYSLNVSITNKYQTWVELQGSDKRPAFLSLCGALYSALIDKRQARLDVFDSDKRSSLAFLIIFGKSI